MEWGGVGWGGVGGVGRGVGGGVGGADRVLHVNVCPVTCARASN